MECIFKLNNFFLPGRHQNNDKFKEFRSRPADGAFAPRGKGNQFSEEYYDYRRKEREQIGTMGVSAAWSGSPTRVQWYECLIIIQFIYIF